MQLSKAFLFAGAASAANVYCSDESVKPVAGINHLVEDFASTLTNPTLSAEDIVNTSNGFAKNLKDCKTKLEKSSSTDSGELYSLSQQFGRISHLIHDELAGKKSTIQTAKVCLDMENAVDSIQIQLRNIGFIVTSEVHPRQKHYTVMFNEDLVKTLEGTKSEFNAASCA
ncbi:hypothetical protein RJ55_07534 [Drechmeria coniospora]|nr:hypothetical protein RJ55_07534 [Drechmeria coniospora]